MATLAPDEPANFSEAMHSPDRDAWTEACKEELNQLEEFNVYRLIELPPGRQALGNRWVFRVKHDATGNFQKRKARLVIQGFCNNVV